MFRGICIENYNGSVSFIEEIPIALDEIVPGTV
jgi:hypothetical protein